MKSGWCTLANIKPELVISFLALFFTIVAFWWLHARRGKLIVSEPHSYALASSSSVLFLRLPLVLYNTGPIPIVVQNLRIWFVGENDVLPLPWRTSRKQLKPASDDGHSMPSAFPVNGRQASQIFIEFGGPFPGFSVEAKIYRIRLEGVLGHKQRWVTLLEFDLRVTMVEHLGQYISYNNTPDWPDKDSQKAAELKAGELLRRLDESAGIDRTKPKDEEQ